MTPSEQFKFTDTGRSPSQITLAVSVELITLGQRMHSINWNIGACHTNAQCEMEHNNIRPDKQLHLNKILHPPWWRHQMETSSALLAICAGPRSPVNSPHKGQWRGALMFSLICVWINGWVNNRETGDLRRYRAHYDVTVMHKTRDVIYHACPRLGWWCLQNFLHIQAERKWTTFRRRHFQTYFHQWKYLNFD